jgi:hypothetical protein
MIRAAKKFKIGGDLRMVSRFAIRPQADTLYRLPRIFSRAI